MQVRLSDRGAVRTNRFNERYVTETTIGPDSE
jgi:hypothetical protein